MIRGRAIHNHMVTRLRRAAADSGARVRVEAYLGPGFGYADLVAELGALRVIVEAERAPRRALNDLAKARAVGATHLVIATPTASVAKSIRRRLRGARRASDPRIIVRTQAKAEQVLTWLFSSIPGAECRADINATNSRPGQERDLSTIGGDA